MFFQKDFFKIYFIKNFLMNIHKFISLFQLYESAAKASLSRGLYTKTFYVCK
jgi:hypothetical protein